jgi:hypothetical protein
LGGAVTLPAEAPVFGLMSEAEAIIQAKAEAKHSEEEGKKLEQAQKAQQQKLKEAEEREKHDEELDKKSKPTETRAGLDPGSPQTAEKTKAPRSRVVPAKSNQPASPDEPKEDPLDKM